MPNKTHTQKLSSVKLRHSQASQVSQVIQSVTLCQSITQSSPSQSKEHRLRFSVYFNNNNVNQKVISKLQLACCKFVEAVVATAAPATELLVVAVVIVCNIYQQMMQLIANEDKFHAQYV